MTEEELQVLIDASIANVPKYTELPAPTASTSWGVMPGANTNSLYTIAYSPTASRLHYQPFVPAVDQAFDGFIYEVTGAGGSAQIGVVELDPDATDWAPLNPGIKAQVAATTTLGIHVDAVTEFTLEGGHLYAMFFVTNGSPGFERHRVDVNSRNMTSWFFLSGTAVWGLHRRTLDSVTVGTFSEPMPTATDVTATVDGQNIMFLLRPA